MSSREVPMVAVVAHQKKSLGGGLAELRELLDGEVIRAADRKLKSRLGLLAYVWTSLRHVDNKPVPTTVRIDGRAWFAGRASCVLLANVGKLTGGITVFEDAQPDDGWLEVGVT